MGSKSLLSVLLIIVLVNYGHGEKFDFCTIGQSSNSKGLAYLITKSPDEQAEQFQEAFEDNVREDKIANEFKKKFGDSIDTIKSFSWHFNFGSLGQININETLLSSLHCIYVYDRELFTEHYNQPNLTAEQAVKFIFDEMSNQEAVLCNFANGSGADEEYLFAHCMHDGLVLKASESTKIIEKGTRKEICVSDVPRLSATTGSAEAVQTLNDKASEMTHNIEYLNISFMLVIFVFNQNQVPAIQSIFIVPITGIFYCAFENE